MNMLRIDLKRLLVLRYLTKISLPEPRITKVVMLWLFYHKPGQTTRDKAPLWKMRLLSTLTIGKIHSKKLPQ